LPHPTYSCRVSEELDPTESRCYRELDAAAPLVESRWERLLNSRSDLETFWASGSASGLPRLVREGG
jgi:hypothetical protein